MSDGKAPDREMTSELQMTGSEKERRLLLHEMLNLAELMLLCGAEVYRVEDTMRRMGTAAGAADVNAFVITSSIVLTFSFPDSLELTETRRIRENSSNDFKRLEQLNAISRCYCLSPCNACKLKEQVRRVQSLQEPAWTGYAGSMLAAGAFAVFFGGTVMDGLLSAGCGAVIMLIQDRLRRYCPNTVTFNILCSLAIGVLIGAIAKLIPGLHADKIMIGDIMLLIPGVTLTVSVRDVLVGDTISGILRLIECLLWTAGIVYGFMMAIRLIGG